jgi:hypothetical protein
VDAISVGGLLAHFAVNRITISMPRSNLNGMVQGFFIGFGSGASAPMGIHPFPSKKVTQSVNIIAN